MDLPRGLADEIAAHALEERPDECCGIVGGSDGVPSTVYRARNAEGSPFRYAIAPTEQLEILNRIEEAGEELIGIYHSHTRTEAYPSQTDVNLAGGWPDALWLIVSLKDPERPDLRAFRIHGTEVEDVDLRIS